VSALGARTCEHVSVALMTSAAGCGGGGRGSDGFMKGKYIHRATSSSISRFSARKEIFFSIFAYTAPEIFMRGRRATIALPSNPS